MNFLPIGTKNHQESGFRDAGQITFLQIKKQRYSAVSHITINNVIINVIVVRVISDAGE
jgi:hypothetical protein